MVGVGVTTIGGAVLSDAEFTAFARQRGDRMLRLAWLITRDAEDARDAVQDALLGLYRSREQLAAADNVDAYVRRAVVNASLRVIGRRPAALPVAELDHLAAPDDPADAVASTDAVWRLCAALGPTQRAAVVLRFFDDLSFAEVAEVLGCAEATARSHVHRALATLRAHLEEEPDGH